MRTTVMNDQERKCAGGETRSGIPVAPAGEQTLHIDEEPAQQDRKVIHPRRPLPLVPDSSERDDDGPSDPDSGER
jgi:hypothetical protein